MITNLPAADVVDFTKSWQEFWGAFSGSASGLVTLAGIAGVLMVVVSICMWIFKKARGGGANTSTVVWMLVIGGVLCAPTVLIPLILTIVEFVINGIASIAELA